MLSFILKLPDPLTCILILCNKVKGANKKNFFMLLRAASPKCQLDLEIVFYFTTLLLALIV